MSTIVSQLFPGPYSTGVDDFGFPTMIVGTNFAFPVIGFIKGAVDQTIYFRLPTYNYGASGPSLAVDVDWYADSAVSGTVRWYVQVAAITPNVDTQDVETKSLDSATVQETTHLGTTGQRLHRTPLTIASADLDALAAGDFAVLRLSRASSHANDTLSGVAYVTDVVAAYSDQ